MEIFPKVKMLGTRMQYEDVRDILDSLKLFIESVNRPNFGSFFCSCFVLHEFHSECSTFMEMLTRYRSICVCLDVCACVPVFFG